MGIDFAINGRFYGQPLTGVQRYAREVVSALDTALGRQDGIGLVLTPRGVKVPILHSIEHRFMGPGSGYVWEQVVLPSRWSGRLLNLCNLAPVTRANQVVCIHDANVFKMPGSYSGSFRLAYRVLLPLISSRAMRIVSTTRDAARQIAAHLPVRERDIAILPGGHEHALTWRPDRSTVAATARLDRPFVMALGSRAQHKNIKLLFEIAPRLDELGVDLVLVGGGGSIFADVAEARGSNVRRFGSVTDDDLAFLMERALCLAFPSWTEGFGLPILEAMAWGCPVVSSDRASMPEVCGGAAIMAAPDDPEAWAVHIAALVASPHLRQELAGRGRDRLRFFSWRRTAERYLSLMSQQSLLSSDAE